MTETIDKWIITATHESGHVIARLHFGIPFSRVRIYQNEAGKVVGRVRFPAGRCKPITFACICCAGPVAEQLLTGVPVFEQPASQTDLAMASHAHPALEAVLPFTLSIIESNWPTLKLLASHLLRERTLTYAQIVDLIR